MLYVVKGESAAFAILQPFLGRLVTADVEVPGISGDIGEGLGGVDEYFARIKFGRNWQSIRRADARRTWQRELYFLDRHGAWFRKGDGRFGDIVHEVEFAEAVAKRAETLKIIHILRIRDAREVHL